MRAEADGMNWTMARLAAELGADLAGGDPETTVRRVTVDSRGVAPGDLFVAVRGASADGHRWVADAVAAGCAAVAVEDADVVPAGTPALRFPSTRAVPALAARLVRGRPDAALRLVGVTGTNGKTTAAYLLRAMLQRLEGGTGLLGTIRYETGTRGVAAPLTTPDGPTLQELLAEMRDAGLKAAAMEISSHALDQERVAGLELDAALMTNLSRDHLDYHADEHDYLNAKLRIRDLLEGPARGKAPGVLAYNADDPAFAVAPRAGLECVRWSTGWRAPLVDAADVKLIGARLDRLGSDLELDVRGARHRLASRLVGRFNVENLTAAVAGGVALGFAPADVCEALAGAAQVPGRMEGFALPSGALAVVDYAHTPDALDAVLQSSRELCGGRLVAVFGCGGDRDTGKRALMGAVASRGADATWITSDNPRSEDPQSVCDMILAGWQASAGADRAACRVEVDRTRAIRGALDEAGEGDVIVVAGKGHEDYQIVGDRRLDLDDRGIVRKWISERGAGEVDGHDA